MFKGTTFELLRVQAETYQVQGEANVHGYSGPLKVSYGGIFTNVGKQFLEVGKKLDTRRDGGELVDGNGHSVESINRFAVSTSFPCQFAS